MSVPSLFFKSIRLIIPCLLFFFTAALAQAGRFNEKGISRESLEYYLSRAVTMAEFLSVDPWCTDGPYPYKADDIRLIRNTGARFIGRAIYRWCRESALNDPRYWETSRQLITDMHRQQPELIFQAAVFEAVSEEVNTIPIPGWVYEALGLPVEKRNFSYNAMLNADGKFVNQWGKGRSVPDITRKESQLWLMFLAGSYINLGCEALHMGQIDLIGMADKNYATWAGFLEKLRNYGRKHARRHLVILDAHTPHGGMVRDGKSLLDFNSFPLRIKPIPSKPMEGALQMGYLDAIYGRSKGCITPSGWQCNSLPYLVEFDNFGISRTPGVADTTVHFIWGYDEISWWYLQTESYRNNWIKYAYQWLREHDENGFLQMPVSRIVTIERGKPMIRNRGNTRSEACPVGLNAEETIKAIFKTHPGRYSSAANKTR